MKVGRRGKHLAIRVPAQLVRQLGLQAGDEVDLSVRDGAIVVHRADALKSATRAE